MFAAAWCLIGVFVPCTPDQIFILGDASKRDFGQYKLSCTIQPSVLVGHIRLYPLQMLDVKSSFGEVAALRDLLEKSMLPEGTSMP